MPDLADDRFAQSVIYMIGHSDEGAMGIVINQPFRNMVFADILDELELGDPDAIIRLPDPIRDRPVMAGGPVERGRGFVLHSADFRSGSTFPAANEIYLTATLDVLRAMAFGPRPRAALLALGCSGWAPGQLESEIAGNGWLTVPFSRDLLFDLPANQCYAAALAKLHITRASFSSEMGRA